jgi:hypothetical protein
MPRYSTYPFLFDDVLSISITKLREWEYLKMNTFKSGDITWSRNGEVTSKLSIRVVINNDEQFVKLDYKCNGTPYNYKIYLEWLESNLGKGKVWYFICPFTKKRCRKLHLINEQFMHRSNLPSGMYESQTKSKKWRGWDKVYGSLFETDKLYEELYSKHFKKFYDGKPTKKYLLILELIRRNENIPYSEIENFI